MKPYNTVPIGRQFKYWEFTNKINSWGMTW